MVRNFLLLASFLGFTGVGLGAFAAHALKNSLSPEYLTVFQTGVHYQMLHALALFGVALLARQVPGRLLRVAGSLFGVGVLLFSGSLYALTLSGIAALGIITPLGGLALLAGWFCLGLSAWRLTAVVS